MNIVSVRVYCIFLGLDCKKTCAYSFPCFPMDVPPNDDRIKNRRCMDFIRSSSICGTDTTSVFFDKLQPREQINQLTAFIDGSQVWSQIMVLIYYVLSINV